jgi:uncharacterized protein (TIGR00251 family)
LTIPGPGLTVQRAAEACTFWIRVSPRARHEGVGGLHGDALRVAVGAPPVEGAANAACVRLLAEALGVRRDAVELDPASRGRRKRVRVTGDPAALETRLRQLAEGPASGTGP